MPHGSDGGGQLIPKGATQGFNRLTFGLLHVATTIRHHTRRAGRPDELLGAGRVRFANRLKAWIERQLPRITVMSTTWKVLLANLTPSSASALRSGHRPIRLAGWWIP
jgi:hypothetical protein